MVLGNAIKFCPFYPTWPILMPSQTLRLDRLT